MFLHLEEADTIPLMLVRCQENPSGTLGLAFCKPSWEVELICASLMWCGESWLTTWIYLAAHAYEHNIENVLQQGGFLITATKMIYFVLT